MKKIIPFNNVVNFNTDVKEITAISLEHEIKKYSDMICGVFYISGEYKITEGLLEKEKFNFELPFDIALTNNYELDTLLVDIDDFRYELISDKSLKVNIDLYIDGEEIQVPEPRYIYNEDIMKDEDTTLIDDLINQAEKTNKIIDSIEKENNIETRNYNEIEKTYQQNKSNEAYEIENESSELKEININNNQNLNINETKNSDELETEKLNSNKIKNNKEFLTEDSNSKPNENLFDAANEITKNQNIDNEYLIKNNDIEPERIELLKDMLTNNDKENDMNKDINLNINNNETNNINDSNNQSITTDLFTPTTEDKYTTYRVYKVVETDTIDTILTKYNITKEMLADYNNIENINPGDKLIIPTNEK